MNRSENQERNKRPLVGLRVPINWPTYPYFVRLKKEPKRIIEINIVMTREPLFALRSFFNLRRKILKHGTRING